MTRVHIHGILTLALCSWACTTTPEQVAADPAHDEDPVATATQPEGPSSPESQFRELSDSERTALGVALQDLGVLDPMIGTARDASAEIRTVGPISFGSSPTPTPPPSSTPPLEAYDGTGIQYEVTFGTSDDFLHTGVLAWKGLDVKTQTVDEVVLVLVNGLVDAGIVDVGGFGADEGLAIIWDQVAGETYLAEEGTFEITSITFDSEVDCLDPSKGWGGDLECIVSEGTLDGALDVPPGHSPSGRVSSGPPRRDFPPRWRATSAYWWTSSPSPFSCGSREPATATSPQIW
ncbi:MAG: hypothetical protein KTR31_31620 [Myxococcales bacterium]|nr:hypothetical protein [Myxococcales bacterium]